MKKHLFLVHGRSFKPDKAKLEPLWFDALKHGIGRDSSADVLDKFNSTEKTFVYFGNFSNDFLRQSGRKYDEAEDFKDRQATFENLKIYEKEDFLDEKGKKIYSGLEGKTSLKEAAADVFATPLDFLGLSERLIGRIAPDIKEYWNADSEFGKNLRSTLTAPLSTALRNDEDVLLMGHSLGSMLSYDVLWKFSHYGEYQDIASKKVSMMITLGSPLGNETVKKNLKGANAGPSRRYPTNIREWINIAAEDDYISHDQTLKNDYRKMERWRLVGSITDHRIYNLAIRDGDSNPHHGVGYLVHPTVSNIVSAWLQ